MIRFAAMLAALPRDCNALPIYLQSAPEADRDACLALLSGQRPKRIASSASLTHWAAEIACIPDDLLAACLAASGDRAEVAALILPAPTGTPPTLAECLHALTSATKITAHASLVTLWQRLPPDARLILNRLASGSFRATIPAEPPAPAENPRTILAVMTLVSAAVPEITVALWHDGLPIPIARVPLTLPETPEILAWARAHAVQRFGPVTQVPPELVFAIAYDGTKPNRRRKSGLDLISPRLTGFRPGASAATLDQLAPPAPAA